MASCPITVKVSVTDIDILEDTLEALADWVVEIETESYLSPAECNLLESAKALAKID